MRWKKRYKAGVILLLMAGAFPAEGQDVQELRTFGGPGLDVGNSIRPVGEEGYVVLGYTDGPSGSQRDAWLLRLDGRGDTLWTRRFGGPGDDHGWDLEVTADGTFVLAGFQETADGDEDVWVLHVSDDGSLLWERTVGGPEDERAWAVTLVDSGDAIVLAQTESFGAGAEDIYIVRIGMDGDTAWTRYVGGAGTDRAFSIVGMGDGALFVGMSDTNRPSLDVLVGTVSSQGETEVDVRPTAPGAELAHGVAPLPGGGYLVTGYGASSPEGRNDLLYLWLDENGREVARRRVHGSGDGRAMMTAVSQDGRTATVGYSHREGDWDVTLAQGTRDNPAVTMWTHQSPGPDRGVMVCPTPAGGWMLTGTLAVGADPGQLVVVHVSAGGSAF